MRAKAARDAARCAAARTVRTTTQFDEEDAPNSFLQVPLIDYVRRGQPRVLFVGYGETDNWAHQGRYDLVLDSAHRFDYFVAPAVGHDAGDAARTAAGPTFIITTDHGRGSGLVEWKEHGVEEKGSENIWIAVMGPDTRPLGERTQVAPVTQAQIAATVAALLGRDYRAGGAAGGRSRIPDVLGARRPLRSRRRRGVPVQHVIAPSGATVFILYS